MCARLSWPLLVVIGCGAHPPGGTGTSGGAAGSMGIGGFEDAGAVPDSGFWPGAHQQFPLVPSNGGPVMSAPEIVSISFGGDGGDFIHGFADWVGTSAWLSIVGADYSVASATHVQSYVFPPLSSSTITDVEIQTMVAAAFADGGLTPPFFSDGGFDQNLLYLLHFPPGTTVLSFDNGPDSCAVDPNGTAIGGYHFYASGSAPFAYAVVPTCVKETADELSVAASHEMIEAATDPQPNSGYCLVDPSSSWSYILSEVADLCDDHWIDAGAYVVTRVYSNSAAADGGSPCIPESSPLYYGVTAQPTEIPSVSAGQSATFTVQGWSNEATDSWTIQAYPVYDGVGSFLPTATLDESSLGNGDTAQLTVTVPAGTPGAEVGVVYLYSYRTIQTFYRELQDFSLWPVVVLSQ